MKEITGDIWDFHEKGHWIVITTNGNLNTKGEAVMGKGIALQAKQRYPDLPWELGKQIREIGNSLHCDGSKGLLFFPTKYDWWEKSDLKLIETSTQEMVDFFDNTISEYLTPVYLVRPGCSNGQLNWKDVKPILEKYLDDRFVVVNR